MNASGKKEDAVGYPIVQLIVEGCWKPAKLRAFLAFATLCGCEARKGGILIPDQRRDDLITLWMDAEGEDRDKVVQAEVDKIVATLTPRARKLWAHVKDPAKFYRWDGPNSGPKAMQELEKAGLVSTMGRVVSIHRCWVPIGMAPFEVERFPSWA